MFFSKSMWKFIVRFLCGFSIVGLIFAFSYWCVSYSLFSFIALLKTEKVPVFNLSPSALWSLCLTLDHNTWSLAYVSII